MAKSLPQLSRCTCFIGAAIVLVLSCVTAQAAAPAPEWLDPSALREAWRAGEAFVIASYARNPALTAGLAIAGVMPLLAALGLALSWMERRRRRNQAELPTQVPPTYGRAWLVLEETADDGGAGAQGLPAMMRIDRELIRIGRDDDNELCLAHDTVHRHHALLHRSADAEFYIADLSGEAGNGVVVNGRKCSGMMLSAGDRIELGAVRLRFDAVAI